MTSPSANNRSPLTPSQRGILIALATAVLLAGIILAALSTFRSTEPPIASETTIAPRTTTTAPQTTTTVTTQSSTTSTTEPEVTTTTTTEPTTTTTTVPIRDSFVLRPDGVDRLFFGMDAEDVIDAVTDRLGAADSDTDWESNKNQYDSLCVGENVRFVSWENLQLFFTDGPSVWADETREHFASYSVIEGPEDLLFATSAGVGPLSTVADISAAYGSDARIFEHPVHGPIFELDPAGHGYLFGVLTGLDATDVVLDLSGGFSCGE